MLRTESIEITPEILSLIAGIDEFKGSWRALGTLAPGRLSALRRVATIESVGSSTRIEGSRLSDREVERLLSNVAVGRFDTRDEQEVAGCAEAMELVHDSWESIAVPSFARSLLEPTIRTPRFVSVRRNLSRASSSFGQAPPSTPSSNASGDSTPTT